MSTEKRWKWCSLCCMYFTISDHFLKSLKQTNKTLLHPCGVSVYHVLVSAESSHLPGSPQSAVCPGFLSPGVQPKYSRLSFWPQKHWGWTVSSMIMGSLPGQDTPGSFPPAQVHPPTTPVFLGWPLSRGSPSSFLTTVPRTEDFDDLINNPPDTLASELPSSLPDTLQFQHSGHAPHPNPSFTTAPHPSTTTWMLLATGPPAPPGPLGLLFQSLPSEPYLWPLLPFQPPDHVVKLSPKETLSTTRRPSNQSTRPRARSPQLSPWLPPFCGPLWPLRQLSPASLLWRALPKLSGAGPSPLPSLRVYTTLWPCLSPLSVLLPRPGPPPPSDRILLILWGQPKPVPPGHAPDFRGCEAQQNPQRTGQKGNRDIEGP